MRGFGSPSSLPGATITQFDSGFGSPSIDAFDSIGLVSDYNGTGFGHPALGDMEDGTNNPPSFAFLAISIASTSGIAAALADNNWGGLLSGEAGDLGGNLIILYSPNAGFPIRGPYDVRLIAPGGEVFPSESEPGCYSAIAGFGDDCATNVSREFLFFTLPKVPQGVYSIRIRWGSVNSVTLSDQILVIPSDDPIESEWLIRAFPVKD